MSSIYDTLNEHQREAVFHTEGPLLILAGAGSGKTRVLTHRIAYLIEEKNVNPWYILAITFTNKAAGEMRNRVDQLVKHGAESVWVSTFHAMCGRILRRYIDRIGYDTNFTIYDTEDQKTVMRDVCKRVNIDTKVFKEQMILRTISSAKNELITAELFERQAGNDYGRMKMAQAYREYEKHLKRNNALDFDDMLVKTVELLEHDAEVRSYYQDRFRYIMVDEYQDTNTVQFRLVSLLADQYENLAVVGDDDQSIYKFRGANIKNILNFESHYPKAKVIKLEQNYRSTSNILDAANAVIQNNKSRKSKALWTDQGEGDKLKLMQFDSGYEEAEFVADDILLKRGLGFSYKDNAVLYRTNAQSRAFEEYFVRSNIPYKIVGGVNFYARREIKDLLAYLKTIDNGKDDLAVRRIINVPKRGIGLTTISRIQESATLRELGFYEALLGLDFIPDIVRSKAKLQSFVTLIEYFKQRLFEQGVSILELTKEIIDVTAYIESLEGDDPDQTENRKQNIDELLSKIKSYEEDCESKDQPATLSGFLEEVALIADIDSLEEDSDYVVLMTLHSAKGLEFPRVYLVGMEDGLFPSYMTIMGDDPEDIEEERRLCYVGITRAERDLTLCFANRRMVRGETQYNKMSRFLKEIPSDYYEMDSGSSRVFNTEQRPKEKKPACKKTSFQVNPYAKPSTTQQFAVKNQDGLDYTKGDRVKHVKLGQGVVIGITEGGKDYEVVVEFDDHGVKRMFSTFAKLEKV